MQRGARSLTVFLLLALCPHVAQGQSTAFTYQGELKNAGSPASGLHDIRFKLFDAASGGAQIGSTVCVDNVQVTGGRFIATIDFGQQFATVSARHLEIDVRQDVGLNCSNTSGYTTLAPRQPITAAPRALAAAAANTLSAPDGSPANAVSVDNAGNVGVNTPNPLSRLHVTSGALADGIRLTGSTGTDPSLSLYEGSTPRGVFGLALATGNYSVDALSGDIVLRAEAGRKLLFQSGASTSALAITSANSVGLGTITPLAKLDVRGDIRFGSSGQLRAIGGEENLRIVRGSILQSGSIAGGSGFTVSPNGDGQYTITFTTPFAAPPSVTASLTGNSTDMNIEVTSTSNTSTRIATWIIALGVRNEREHAFNFIAVGPR